MPFKMPTKSDLKSRSSTISNAFTIAVTPYIRPSSAELVAYYKALEIKDRQCAYCLGIGNGVDHLKPLVSDGMPTGYITDIHNLVPCCQRCNSSKGSNSFTEWYLMPKNVARLKKTGMTDADIIKRYNIIVNYEKQVPEPLDYESIVGPELWNEYKRRRAELLRQLDENQKFCDALSKIITTAIKQ